MTDREIIRKIQQLKEIQPSQEWLDLTRQKLLSRTVLWTEPKELSLRDFLMGYLGYFKLAAVMAGALVLLIGGPWLVVKASQPSLPGEMLYSIKKATERIQAGVASDESKAQLQVEFAGRRLEELTKINEDSLSPEEKTEKVEQVVSDFQDNLAGASLHVSKISKEKAVAIAKTTKKLKENLAKTKEEVPLAVQEKLAQAEKVMAEINHQILAVLVKGDQEGIGQAATTTDEEILIFLELEEESLTNETSTEIIGE